MNKESVRGIFLGVFSLVCYILGSFYDKTIISLVPVRYEMIIANSVLYTSHS